MTPAVPNLLSLLDVAAYEAGALATALAAGVGHRVRVDGRLDRKALDDEQHIAHGLAWSAAYAETLRQVSSWAHALDEEDRFGEAEALPAQLLAHEYLSQLVGGLPMSQGEMFRPADVFAPAERMSHVIGRLRPGAAQPAKARIVELLAQSRGRPSLEASGLDETLEAVRDQFDAFAAEKIAPFAHGWHVRDELIPLPLIEELGALRTRAVRDGEVWKVSGAKTWITHASRADLMTLLVRTNPDSRDHRGLSMFLAGKPRGTAADPFPAAGMSGGEIAVIGYRGMKEYELAFDRFEVPDTNLLGGEPGQGFAQLMGTFESARIQTAARAIGVGQNALDLALDYALNRKQFDQPIAAFPRVANKLAMMAAELLGARRLAWFAARAKDEGRRCDLEAGMAKLTAARIAWAAADNALQIHGGTGFAVEQPASRLLADARILNIFEGAGEIQAQVIARRLLEGAN